MNVHITMNPRIESAIQAPRKVPLALEKAVENELQSLLQQGIIEPVKEYAPFQSPIVVVAKKDGSIRMCVDMREANKAVMKDCHPFPTWEQFSARLCGAKWFSKLDLKNAFYHVQLDESSRKVTTFTTHLGLFRFKRLMFGLSASPEIFQRVLEEVLRGLEGVIVFADDILVFGPNESTHERRLKAVLKRLEETDLTLNVEKCEFTKQTISFLGHVISEEGVRPDPLKMNAISLCSAPKNASELLSFLGLMSYVGSRFVKNLSELTEPLRLLTQKGIPFIWGPEQHSAFEKLKREASNIQTLGFFCSGRKTLLFADASPIALGAVLAQEDEKGRQQVT